MYCGIPPGVLGDPPGSFEIHHDSSLKHSLKQSLELCRLSARPSLELALKPSLSGDGDARLAWAQQCSAALLE